MRTATSFVLDAGRLFKAGAYEALMCYCNMNTTFNEVHHKPEKEILMILWERGMEEEPVYEDMAAEGSLEDSDAESQQSHGKMASLLWDLIWLLMARLPGMMIQEQMRVLNIIMTEAYKLKQLSMTTETVTKVVKMIKEGTKTPDPSALLVDLSKTVSADIGRLVCSAVRKMNPKTFYMPVPYPKRSKKKSLTFD
ncbi:unnamed protein product [Caretta caretta]